MAARAERGSKNMIEFFSPFLAAFLAFSSIGGHGQVNLAKAGAPINSFPIAADRKENPGPTKRPNLSRGVDTSAQSVLVLDLVSGKSLFNKNADRILPIASLTKLMSAVVLADLTEDWQAVVEFTAQDRKGGNKPNIYPGEKLTKSQLLTTALIGSDNDAMTALARSSGLAKEDFVKKMNEKASSLGMFNTTFVEPTGLDPANKSNAHDLANLVRAAFNSDRIRKATTLDKYQLKLNKKSRTVFNTNQLLRSIINAPPYQVVGGKTGYIEESDYNLAVEIKNSEATLIAIVLGSKSNNDRFQEVKSLVSWAFENYQWPGVSVATLAN